MKWFISFLCLFASLSSWAELKSIESKNLDFYYIFPRGFGEIEQLKIGIEKKTTAPVAFEILALNPGYSIDLPFFQLEWHGNEPILEQVKELKVKSSHISLNRSKHTAIIEEVELNHELIKKMSIRQMKANCEGLSVSQELEVRLVEDCYQSGQITIKDFFLPLGTVIIGEIIENLPDQTDEDIQTVVNDLEWSSTKGDFTFALKVKLLVKSRVKARGHWSADFTNKQLTLRLDEVKFGILPVTDIVFKELKKRIKDPKIVIEKPNIIYSWK